MRASARFRCASVCVRDNDTTAFILYILLFNSSLKFEYMAMRP